MKIFGINEWLETVRCTPPGRSPWPGNAPSLGSRWYALVSDLCYLAVPAGVLYMIGTAVVTNVDRFSEALNDALASSGWQRLLLVFLFVLFRGVPQSRCGQSPGQRLTGMRVTGPSGSPPSLATALARNLVIALPFAMWLPGAVDWMKVVLSIGVIGSVVHLHGLITGSPATPFWEGFSQEWVTVAFQKPQCVWIALWGIGVTSLVMGSAWMNRTTRGGQLLHDRLAGTWVSLTGEASLIEAVPPERGARQYYQSTLLAVLVGAIVAFHGGLWLGRERIGSVTRGPAPQAPDTEFGPDQLEACRVRSPIGQQVCRRISVRSTWRDRDAATESILLYYQSHRSEFPPIDLLQVEVTFPVDLILFRIEGLATTTCDLESGERSWGLGLR